MSVNLSIDSILLRQKCVFSVGLFVVSAELDMIHGIEASVRPIKITEKNVGKATAIRWIISKYGTRVVGWTCHECVVKGWQRRRGHSYRPDKDNHFLDPAKGITKKDCGEETLDLQRFIRIIPPSPTSLDSVSLPKKGIRHE